jgi:hypothetical protein
MGKKKADLVQEAKGFYAVMKEELPAAKISKDRINRVIGRLFDDKAEMKMDEVRRTHKFLKSIHDGPFQRIKTVRAMIPPEVWANYAAMDLTDLREQVLLKEAQSALNKEWGNVRKRKKKEKKDEVQTTD